ncbi:MAG: hypothetical protein QN178_14645 [Armatimonadota bacterium]|nr:hypothetical protein [Armatimonadota bacterium]
MTRPAVDQVDRIAGLADPVVRNLQITQCYHDLSVAMRRFTSGGANWCTFATWASKQAGSTIRSDDLPRALEDVLDRAPEFARLLDLVVDAASLAVASEDATAVRDALRQAVNPQPAFDRASGAVARGNLKVFAEIGREFARFLAALDDDAAVDAGVATQFCASLRPGEPPDGQRLLREAFTAYAEARRHGDDKTRAELLYLANVLIGLHEQTRLQPDILAALNAPASVLDDLRPRLLAVVLPGVWLRIRHTAARLLRRRLPLDEALDRLVACVKGEARRVITQALMVLRLPAGTLLPLGRDLRSAFPPVLKTILSPRVHDVLRDVDLTPDSLAGSGAQDWADLRQRMHFIADFFRAWHERPELFNPPFSPAQAEAIAAGRRPDGRL